MKDLIWDTFEVLVNFYQSLLITWFIYKFLQHNEKRHPKIMMILFWMILGISITILNSITLFESLSSCIYISILFVYVFITFKDKLLKKVFVSIIPISITLVVTGAELNLFSSILGMSVEELVIDRSLKRFCCLLLIQISLYIALRLVLKTFFYLDEYTLADWLPILTILCATYILCTLIHNLSLSVKEDQRIFIHTAYFVLLIFNFVMFYVIYSLYQKNKQINEMKLIKLKEQYLEQFIENADSQYDSIRKIRHDIKGRLATVYELISNENYAEAMRFIEKSSEVIDRTETFVQTNNTVANAIINSKLTIASTLGIKVSCITVADLSGIDEADLCDLFSNILENAIAACKEIEENKKRFIYLQISKENNIYTFLVKNSVSHTVIKKNPKLKTTKSDKSRHGLGTSIIRDIAAKYNGRCDFYEIDNTFCCSVILKI